MDSLTVFSNTITDFDDCAVIMQELYFQEIDPEVSRGKGALCLQFIPKYFRKTLVFREKESS